MLDERQLADYIDGHFTSTLFRLRLPGAEAARRAGITQSKVSRAETGAFLPAEDDVKKLCRVYGATVSQQRQLVKMTRDLHEGSTLDRQRVLTTGRKFTFLMAEGALRWNMGERQRRGFHGV